MSKHFSPRRRALATTALVAAAGLVAGQALAANVIRIDISGSGTAGTLTITQDATNPSNILTANGLAGGGQLPIRGAWAEYIVNQQGAGNILQGAITAAGGSTTASANLAYGSAADGGANRHTLSVGQTTAPTNPDIDVLVVNTEPEEVGAENVILDTLDGASLDYDLTINGSNTDITNTIAATGAVTLNLTVSGGTLAGGGNAVTNTISNATSANVTVALNSDGNVVTNTANTAGAKTFNVTLTGAANGNTVSNDFTGGSGAQSSTLTVTGATSRVNFDLDSSSAGSTSAVTLSNFVGAAGAAGNVTIDQTGAGVTLGLTVNGGAFTAGAGGVQVTQAGLGAVTDMVFNAAANGYTVTVSQ
ncbi:hypothetical protein [Phenylobacterium sp. CCH12-B4]|uniref:hypothetical protein n=3 Tax=unclassified Phenylobacterium TaxID=2640670 RepID=UPI000839E895|nr:hypothetical protein [Phenylobacterium sp. CCH12-B4]